MLLRLTDMGLKQDLFRNIRNLQGKQASERIRVANYLTKKERDQEINLYMKAKNLEEKGEENSQDIRRLSQSEATYGNRELTWRRNQGKHQAGKNSTEAVATSGSRHLNSDKTRNVCSTVENKLYPMFSNADIFSLDEQLELNEKLKLMKDKPHMIALQEVKPENFNLKNLHRSIAQKDI